MKWKKRGVSAAALLLICAMTLTLTACAKPADIGVFKVFEITAKEAKLPLGNEVSEGAIAAARGANDFAFRFSAELAAETAGENFVCSPVSVWLPLAALLNATDGTYSAQLLQALGAEGVSVQDINGAASAILAGLTNEWQKRQAEKYREYTYYNPLQIVNAVFVDKSVTLKPKFAQPFADYFMGVAANIDFTSSEAAREVNKWAGDNTQGLITDIVREFDPNTVAAIASAVYFSDRWQWEFDPNETKTDIFRAPNGDIKANYMSRQGLSQVYYEDDKLQAMPLTLKSSFASLWVLLPKDGSADELLRGMTSDYFDEIQNDAISASGELLLPKFSIDSGAMEIAGALSRLGVPLFSGAPLTELIKENIPVAISGALQKAVIKVDEKGTTAAAVTVIEMAGSAMPQPTEPFSMICDRPFAFVLCVPAAAGGAQVVFTGIVNHPE